jgi:very-short-patch-repair endonuclease
MIRAVLWRAYRRPKTQKERCIFQSHATMDSVVCFMSESAHTESLGTRMARADRRTVLLDEEAERNWLRQLSTNRKLLRIAPEDWVSADEWLSGALRFPVVHRCSAEWAGSLLQADASMLMNLSAPLRAKFAERLLTAAGDAFRNTADLCAGLLGWTTAPLTLGRFERWAAFAAIVPGETLPVIMLDGRAQFRTALGLGDQFAIAGVPVALCATPERWRDFLNDDTWTRSETRWRFAMSFTGADLSISGGNFRERATEEFVRLKIPSALPLLEKARAALSEKGDRRSSSDAARSAAEAFLHAALEARAFTRGRFQLNAALDFSFGTRAAEGDLADKASRVVIEVDGYYHFREPEAYRRDRRKDSLYQEHGWFVIRFLADDVVREIERVLSHVEHVLSRREAVRAHPSTHE